MHTDARSITEMQATYISTEFVVQTVEYYIIVKATATSIGMDKYEKYKFEEEKQVTIQMRTTMVLLLFNMQNNTVTNTVFYDTNQKE